MLGSVTLTVSKSVGVKTILFLYLRMNVQQNYFKTVLPIMSGIHLVCDTFIEVAATVLLSYVFTGDTASAILYKET